MQMGVTLSLSRFHIDRNRMERAMTDAALGNDGLSEVRYRRCRPFQNHGFDAVIVIQMSMHGRYGHIMMIVLHSHEAASELPFVVIVDVTQNPHAVLRDLGFEAL